MPTQKWHYCMAVIVFVALILISPTAGGSAMNVWSETTQSKFLKIGHRGAMGYEPENTIRSFQKAIDLGVDAVELDVRICKSGEVVVIHDDRVDGTTNGTGFVRDKTLEELKDLDTGKGEKIPLLTEVLDAVKKSVIVDIELKEAGTAGPVAKIIRQYVLKRRWNYYLFIVASFLPDELKTFKELIPDIKTSLLGNSSPDLLLLGQKLSVSSLAVHYGAITEDFIAESHRKKMEVFVWTVNHENDIARMKAYGVDGVISDFPNKL
ncbi:MAG: glycerophosphodiester phosphodiesterase family protein [Candidatus Parcubacteria bacterium]|nr:glycerophosphodiester phosphodiesterase family protein [Candidatus Parcubacteria bacterium]